MNEFFKPNRTGGLEDNYTSESVTYDDPAQPINIVVDENQPQYTHPNYNQQPMNSNGQYNSQQPQQVVNNYYVNNSQNYTNSNNSINSNNVSYHRGMKRKSIALLLCFFLGVLGIHRFYEGKIASGILWACTGGLFGVGWIIDFIILLFKPRFYNP